MILRLSVEWLYKPQGTFSINEYAQGQYTVAMAIRFLDHTLDGNYSWVCGFEMVLAGEKFDCDLAFWGRPCERFDRFRADPILIWGECKSFNQLKQTDADRLVSFSKLVNGSVVLYATLKTELPNKEKERLIRVKNALSQQGSDLLILTGIELLSVSAAPACWTVAGGRYAQFASGVRDMSLSDLCASTQHLHLDKSCAQAQRGQGLPPEPPDALSDSVSEVN